MLQIIRYKTSDGAILGKMYLNGAFVCYTLENASKAIPCGFYSVDNSTSPKFKRELPLIHNEDVSASRGIRIHVGNSVSDASGCILVGMSLNGDRLKDSSAAEHMVTMLTRNNTELAITEV